MKFSSEIERMQHPQVRLIPLSIWSDYRFFNGEISNLALTLMQTPPQELKTVLQEILSSRIWSEQEKICLGFSLAFGHPDLSDQVLVELFNELHLPQNELFRFICILGNVGILETIISQYPVVTHQDMIAADNYRTFSDATGNGHLAVLERLVSLAPDKVQNMIAANHYYAFRIAAYSGHLAVLERLMSLAPDKVQDMIVTNGYSAFRSAVMHNHTPIMYYAFRSAAENGHLAVLERLMSLAPDKVQDMIAAKNYGAFRMAAANGHLALLERLVSLAPDKVQNMIAAYDYYAFHYAAEYGHLAVLKRLMSWAPDKVQDMIAANSYAAFRNAAYNGHLAVLERLMSWAPDKVQDMIAAKDYDAFRSAIMHNHTPIIYSVFHYAAEDGHLAVLERLMSLAPDKVQNMIAANHYYAFRIAAYRGHLAVLEWLIRLAPDKVQDMIVANGYSAFRSAVMHNHTPIIYYAFRSAAANGHLAVLERLMSLAPDKVQDMIAANSYAAFRSAAKNGHLAVLERLMSLAPDKVQDMIVANGYSALRSAVMHNHTPIIYYAFRSAAKNGHLAVLERLMSWAPDKVQDMIADNFYEAFRRAAEKGHLAVLERLISLAPDKVHNMVAAYDYEAFRNAAMNNHTLIINRLLSFPLVFSYAELHRAEYVVRLIRPYITQTLQTLHLQKSKLEQENPHAIFDIDDLEKAKLLFYFIRHLIRCNDPVYLDEMRFLLEIPSVKRLVATAVAPSIVENELLRLAVRIGNQEAAELLLALPEVQQLAQQHDYYRDEAQGRFDLRALAQDRESSMTSLSTDEQKRLQAVTTRYLPVLKAAGTAAVFNNLKEELETRYAQNPATMMLNREGIISSLILPIDWESFQALELSALEKKEAFQAYYQNKVHSAWRYLSRPNPWMHERASYVYVNPENPREKWSTFEEYLPLIGLLYLAAQDEGMPVSDGYTLETRLEHFIEELALIGRAHNWDDIRVNRHGAEEEFDDLEGDRPSCYSGVKRRLFQSVQGHPLFKILTTQLLKQEIQTEVYSHFQTQIHDGNRNAIKTAWYETLAPEEAKDEEQHQNLCLLKTLDISQEQQQGFLTKLGEKYGPQFSENKGFGRLFHQTFALDATEAHVLKLSYVGVEFLLNKASSTTLVSQAGFYARAEPPLTDNASAESSDYLIGK